ncbi:MAG TPA: potassium/proton antiporter [Solirubrobacterales bacterium]|jgi:cell volume regulation protein A|nr:potassium/proton antiporter [Solirubrobacterales bacterium]
MQDAELILIGGTLLALGIAAALVADRVKVPGLLLFLGLGMLVGSEGIGGVEFDDAELTRTLGTIGLVLILFEGGLSAGWREIRPVLATAVSLATVGTVITAVVAGFASAWILGLSNLEGLILGAAVAATDSAAIFAVLRGSNLRRRIARSLEGESGMNDPVALLLVTGFIAWIEEPGYGLDGMAVELFAKLGLGAVLGVLVGLAARGTFRRLDYPTQGLYPVASIATAAISYGVAEVAQGSGFLAVYLTALILGTGQVPGRRTIVAFHQGLGWVSQISLFFLLGLLVFPSQLIDVAGKGLLISGVLIFVARPLAALLASLTERFSLRERLMLGWAGLRGAVPIWLATFPVIEGLDAGGEIFNIIFFVVVTSTLVQGVSFEPLARRLGLTTTEPALPRPLVESGTIRRLGGEVFAYRVDQDAAIVGRPVRDLRLPREAIVNVIVRGGEAIPPRGSTEIEGSDELHILVRAEVRGEVEELMRRWREGPLDEQPRPRFQPRGAPQIFNVRRWSDGEGDIARPDQIAGVAVTQRLRTRRDSPGALMLLEDGRYAVTGELLVAVGGRGQVAAWAARRYAAAEGGGARAWWQEIAGVLNAPAR